MRKFLCKETGAILLVRDKETIKQMIKSDAYEEVKEVENKAKKTSEPKTINDMNKKELIAFLNDKGIDCNDNMKKEELLLLVPESDEE